MAERRLPGLQRVLGVNALSSTAYGNVGSSIYYALGLVAALALGLTPVVFVITGFIFYLTAATYAEATAMYPEAGGSSSFARHAFNELWSFLAAWGQMLNYVITIAISAFFVPHYLGGLFWEPLTRGPADVLFGIGVVVVLAAVNVLGAREATGVNIVLAVVDFLSQVLLVVVGAALVFSPEALVANVDLGVAPTWRDFLIAIPVGMIAYTGIETISNMAEEARDEETTIPRAINRVVIAVFTIYAALPLVALSALPVTCREGVCATPLGQTAEEGGFSDGPLLGITQNLGLGPLESAATLYVGLLAATILIGATNAGIIGVSRLVYSMGLHRQLPDRLRQLHPRFRTPWVGILLFGGVACLTLIPGEAAFLANIYAFGAMLSFTVAHAAVVRLRLSQPDRRRPYRGPGTLRLGGRDLPLFALVGGTFTAIAFVTVTALHLEVAVAGAAWLALGLVTFALYRRSQGLDLMTTAKVALPKPATEHEAEYESILVAFDERHYVPEAVATAVKLAARRRRGIHVLVTINVPASSPIGAHMPDQERAAQEIVEQAKLQGGRRVSGHWEKVRPGGTGRLIVDEAREMRARAVVMPLPRRASSGSLFGKTLETVLADRPCRVIVESAPGDGAPARPRTPPRAPA
jgi:basic amino acid/polyamine antiporter, APA family